MDYGYGHSRTNEFVGTMPIKEAIKKQNEKIRDRKIKDIYRWFYKYDY